PEPEPEPEPEPVPEPEPEPYSEPAEDKVYHPFMAWMDGVCGMEKTADYTLQSGHAEEVEPMELPIYQYQDIIENDETAVLQIVAPWYVRMWQKIKNYCSNNRFPWFCRAK
ncbi:MAG: hypothetical protein IKT79_08605, partial [Akkermansia sp.]|nr:hypothetical protein [Akkermansia sp.]